MAHIPTLVVPLASNSFPLLLPVSWCDNVGVFHIVGMRCPHQRYLRGGKGITFSSTKKCFPLLVNIYDKFVLHVYHVK